MATTKPQSITTATTASTDSGVNTESASTERSNEPATADQQTQAVDFAASPTWGQGGCFVINEQGQRVPAPAN